MFRTYRLLLDLMDRRERRMAAILLALVLVSALLETVGVAAILPFLRILSEPAVIEQNAVLRFIYETGGFVSARGFSLFAGAAVFGLIAFSLLIKAATAYALIRFGLMRSFSISSRLLKIYLHQPYAWFLGRHSSVLTTTVLGEVNTVVTGSLLPALQLLPGLASALMIIGFVFWLEPGIGLGATIALGGGYGLIYAVTRGLIARMGEMRLAANRARFRSISEATGGLKELKIMGLESRFSRRFDDAAFTLARVQSKSQVLRQMPRFALEGIAFGGIILMLIYLILRDAGDLSKTLPMVGMIVVAFGRLFPALQQTFAQVSNIRFNQNTLLHLHDELTTHRLPPQHLLDLKATAQPLRLHERLRLEDISYAYPSGDKPALRDLDLEIAANTTVGLVGGTGAGKTTLVDLILGLLQPDGGRIVVDGTPLGPETLPGWQRSIGYVPQQIFLTDGSVAENIAFGQRPEEIDQAAVERAARIAALHDFVSQELPQGYATQIGERGVRLSGGQRQRIGIARALYHDPDVLIMDEATSALDNLTERAVMEAVQNIAGQKTIVMIAHRLSTVRRCDRIFLMRRGRVEAAGSFDELVASSAEFREMARAS